MAHRIHSALQDAALQRSPLKYIALTLLHAPSLAVNSCSSSRDSFTHPGRSSANPRAFISHPSSKVKSVGAAHALQNARNVLDNFISEFLYMKQNYDWGILTYTFHPHVIGRGQRMLELERLIRTLRGEGAKFITMEEGVQEYRRKFPAGVTMRGQ